MHARIPTCALVFLCGLLLAAGCCRGKRKAEELVPIATTPDVEEVPAEELAQRRADSVKSTLAELLGATRLEYDDPPSTGEVAEALIKGGATSVGYLYHAGGLAYGFSAEGEGEEFGNAVYNVVEDMTEKKVAEQFLVFAKNTGWKNIQFEIVFGEVSWIRAGAAGVTAAQVRTLLKTRIQVQEEWDRVLADGLSGGTVEGLFVYISKKGGFEAAIPVTVKDLPEEVDEDDVLNTVFVQVERYSGWPDLVWVRRPGLTELEMVDWQTARGFDKDDAGRLGTVHGIIDQSTCTEILWESGRLKDTLFYHYTMFLKDVD